MTYKASIARALVEPNKFLIDWNNKVSTEIDNITIELMQKIRL